MHINKIDDAVRVNLSSVGSNKGIDGTAADHDDKKMKLLRKMKPMMKMKLKNDKNTDDGDEDEVEDDRDDVADEDDDDDGDEDELRMIKTPMIVTILMRMKLRVMLTMEETTKTLELVTKMRNETEQMKKTTQIGIVWTKKSPRKGVSMKLAMMTW